MIRAPFPAALGACAMIVAAFCLGIYGVAWAPWWMALPEFGLCGVGYGVLVWLIARPPMVRRRRGYLDLLCRVDVAWLWVYGSLGLFALLVVATLVAVVARLAL